MRPFSDLGYTLIFETAGGLSPLLWGRIVFLVGVADLGAQPPAAGSLHQGWVRSRLGWSATGPALLTFWNFSNSLWNFSPTVAPLNIIGQSTIT